jgi:hypothetical protein
MFGALADTLEVGLYFAVKLETVAAGAALKRSLYDIAP